LWRRSASVSCGSGRGIPTWRGHGKHGNPARGDGKATARGDPIHQGEGPPSFPNTQIHMHVHTLTLHLARCRRPPVRGGGARLAAELLLCLHLRRQLRPQAVQLRMVGMGRGGTVPWGAWVPHGWRGQDLGFFLGLGSSEKKYQIIVHTFGRGCSDLQCDHLKSDRLRNFVGKVSRKSSPK